MIISQQRKGRNHIEYINKMAIAYWAKLNWKHGTYVECLRDAMKEHREYLIRCVEEQRKILLERMPRCRDCMTHLEQNDIFHYGSYCRDCFSCRMSGEIREKIGISPAVRQPMLRIDL